MRMALIFGYQDEFYSLVVAEVAEVATFSKLLTPTGQ